MLTFRHTDALIGSASRVEAVITCDGCAYHGTLGITCRPPIHVSGAVRPDEFLNVVASEIARGAGWKRRMWDHQKFGEAWLCPECAH